MSLQLVLGSSGAGKSYELYQNIIQQSLENPHKNFIIIVPEQFTMQTQKELVSLHPHKGILNIDVLSFGRLAFRVFEELGKEQRIILDDTGKNLVIRKLAGQVQGDLKVLGKNLKKIGYISEVKSIISELTQYNISAEQLEQVIDATKKKTRLNYKLQDIAVIYQAFEAYLQDKYITAEEILFALCQIIPNSSIVKNSVFALDGFTGFTPVQNEVLIHLMKLAEKIYITITLDTKEDYMKIEGEHKLFHLSKKTIHSLYQLAKESKIEIEEPIQLGKQVRPRFKTTAALDFLEQNLFRYNGQDYRIPQNNIFIQMEKNPLEEIRFVASQMKNLIRENKYRYRDFAVVTGNIESYGNHLERIFNEYEIPCFIDNKRSILFNPFVDFIRAALEMIVLNFSYESVFRFLRCNLSVLTKEKVDLLENYVIALGIKGFKRWNMKWVRYHKKMKEDDLILLNEIRAEFMREIAPFTITLQKKDITVKELTISLYEFICANEMQKRLKKYEEYFHKEKELALEKEYTQIYRIIMELLDQVVELLGDEPITIKEYAQVLDAGFEEAKVGIIPPSVDQVVVGDIERTRLKDIKVLFFVGINDGIIPKPGNNSGILSDLDREALQQENMEMAPTARQNAYIQKLYLYLNMTKPSEKLYLSFSKTDMNGGALRPSYLIGSMKKLFTQIEVIDGEQSTDMIGQVATYKSGLSHLIAGFQKLIHQQKPRSQEYEKQWRELYNCYYENPEYKTTLETLVNAAFYSQGEEKISKAVAKALYGNVLENSVTRLEKYAACAFAHFLNYGLQLTEREVYGFEPVDMGNIFHNSLEVFSKELRENGYTWFDIPEEKQDALVEKCVEEATIDFNNTVLHSTSRNEYVIARMKRIMKRTIWALQKQIKKGDFVPSGYEVSFHMAGNLDSINIMLSEDEKLKLKGRIDRLDTCEEEDKVYVKIIDYKSGETDFDMVALYHGLQLQLVVYLNAALEIEQKKNRESQVIPAGIFYYNVKDPITNREEDDSEEKIKARLLKDLKMKGLVNDNSDIIHKLDKEMTKDSSVIPVSYNKDGSFSRFSSVASSEQFSQLSAYVNEKIRGIGTEILDGKIQVSPYELENKNGCEYCNYGGICGFDKKIQGYEFRKLPKYQKEEIWAKLSGAETLVREEE
jgi:helicase-exonuclease AddAB, AddB subunit